MSVSGSIAKFVEEYRDQYDLRTKSAVVERALELLRERELEKAYASAARESDSVWDVTSADGLADDDWS